MALIDLTGQTFGRLTVIERDNSKPKGHGKRPYWLCQCECGNIKSVRTDHLRNLTIQSCGCLHKETVSKQFTKDITGQKFGLLTAIKPLYINSHAETVWLCKCDCGNFCERNIGSLTDKRYLSHCGCVNVRSNGEELIKVLLEENKINYKREYSFKDLRGDKLPLRFDFAIFNNKNKISYLIEYNGYYHYNVDYKGNVERFEKQKKYDKLKVDYCEAHNIPLLIINDTKDIIKEKIILEELLCTDI